MVGRGHVRQKREIIIKKEINTSLLIRDADYHTTINQHRRKERQRHRKRQMETETDKVRGRETNEIVVYSMAEGY